MNRLFAGLCPGDGASIFGRGCSRIQHPRVPDWIATAACALVLCSTAAQAQSTFGTVLGTVKESSGAVVPGAKVQLMNKGTNSARESVTTSSGNYEFTNVDVGTYSVQIEAPGFQKVEFTDFALSARESKRLDTELRLATQSTTVNVESSAGSTVQTDTSSIAETKGSRELIDLPVAIGTRASGSTSPMSTLTAQPGVQTDANGNISVAGALPTQLSMSIDGISSVGPATQGALSEMFPSFNAIEEIRIGETINPAEFGGVADITTISKAGTNSFHGGVFENLQNSYMNASNTFSHTVPTLKMNNFGIFLGGPVIFPKLYNGKDKTFFFGSFEALRLPKTQTEVLSVPTAAMRNGDLSVYSDPLTGYPGNQIPQSQISPFATKLLNTFYPLPNYGAPGDVANNYLASFAVPISSNQGDVRIDQALGTKHQIYARYSYKNRRVIEEPAGSNANNPPPGSPLLGNRSVPEIDNALTVAHNFVITPNLINEARAGFSQTHGAVSFGPTAQLVVNELGLTGLPGAPPGGDAAPTVSIAGFLGIYGASQTNREGTKQFLDTLTWTKGKHTMKFGGDYRYLNGLFTNVFASDRLGNYQFNGTTTSGLLGGGAATPFASFLLGIPDISTIATVINPDTNSYAQHFAFFGQDDWKVSQNLTLNFGLRYEYHPSFHDHYNNLANFVPSIKTTVDGQTVNGAVVIPNNNTLKILNPGFVESIAPTPVLTASQAGIPDALRYSQRTDFAPRIGFAWRPFHNDKTVIRGGYGRYIETLLTSAVYNGWAVESSDVSSFTNSLDANGIPAYRLPYAWPSNIAQNGSQAFYLATDTHYKDPYVQQFNFTVERDLGAGIGLRVSYDGSHGSNLGVNENLNQTHANTTGYDATQTPFPLLQYIAYQLNTGYSNYNAITVSGQKRMSHGLQFQSSYVYTRNLSNTPGAAISSAQAFPGEAGGTLSDPYNPKLDYGNVPYSRRNRFLTTFLYDLPFGKGRAFLNSSNGIVDRVVNGWELSGVLLFQTGPFMTVTTLSDPSGTGYNLFNYNGGRADTVKSVSPTAGQSVGQWINPAAFADPGSNIGRFGDASSGSVVGPGTNNVSMSLIKTIRITEGSRIQIGAQVANLFNHPNYAPPSNLTVGVAGFGTITSLQTAESSGPRSIQLTARINF